MYIRNTQKDKVCLQSDGPHMNGITILKKKRKIKLNLLAKLHIKGAFQPIKYTLLSMIGWRNSSFFLVFLFNFFCGIIFIQIPLTYWFLGFIYLSKTFPLLVNKLNNNFWILKETFIKKYLLFISIYIGYYYFFLGPDLISNIFHILYSNNNFLYCTYQFFLHQLYVPIYTN